MVVVGAAVVVVGATVVVVVGAAVVVVGATVVVVVGAAVVVVVVVVGGVTGSRWSGMPSPSLSRKHESSGLKRMFMSSKRTRWSGSAFVGL